MSIREQQQELCDQLEAIKRTALEMEIYRALGECDSIKYRMGWNGGGGR